MVKLDLPVVLLCFAKYVCCREDLCECARVCEKTKVHSRPNQGRSAYIRTPLPEKQPCLSLLDMGADVSSVLTRHEYAKSTFSVYGIDFFGAKVLQNTPLYKGVVILRRYAQELDREAVFQNCQREWPMKWDLLTWTSALEHASSVDTKDPFFIFSLRQILSRSKNKRALESPYKISPESMSTKDNMSAVVSTKSRRGGSLLDSDDEDEHKVPPVTAKDQSEHMCEVPNRGKLSTMYTSRVMGDDVLGCAYNDDGIELLRAQTCKLSTFLRFKNLCAHAESSDLLGTWYRYGNQEKQFYHAFSLVFDFRKKGDRVVYVINPHMHSTETYGALNSFKRYCIDPWNNKYSDRSIRMVDTSQRETHVMNANMQLDDGFCTLWCMILLTFMVAFLKRTPDDPHNQKLTPRTFHEFVRVFAPVPMLTLLSFGLSSLRRMQTHAEEVQKKVHTANDRKSVETAWNAKDRIDSQFSVMTMDRAKREMPRISNAVLNCVFDQSKIAMKNLFSSGRHDTVTCAALQRSSEDVVAFVSRHCEVTRVQMSTHESTQFNRLFASRVQPFLDVLRACQSMGESYDAAHEVFVDFQDLDKLHYFDMGSQVALNLPGSSLLDVLKFRPAVSSTSPSVSRDTMEQRALRSNISHVIAYIMSVELRPAIHRVLRTASTTTHGSIGMLLRQAIEAFHRSQRPLVMDETLKFFEHKNDFRHAHRRTLLCRILQLSHLDSSNFHVPSNIKVETKLERVPHDLMRRVAYRASNKPLSINEFHGVLRCMNDGIHAHNTEHRMHDWFHHARVEIVLGYAKTLMIEVGDWNSADVAPYRQLTKELLVSPEKLPLYLNDLKYVPNVHVQRPLRTQKLNMFTTLCNPVGPNPTFGSLHMRDLNENEDKLVSAYMLALYSIPRS